MARQMRADGTPYPRQGTSVKTVEEKATSTDRHQIQVRARRRARSNNPKQRAKLFSQDMPALGYKPLDEWTEIELARGRPKLEDGTWAKNIPRWLTEEVRREIDKRFEAAVGERMNYSALEGLIMARKVMKSSTTPRGVQLDAAKFFVEQRFGKAVQKVDVQGQLKVEALLGVALINPDGNPAYGSAPITALIESKDTDERSTSLED